MPRINFQIEIRCRLAAAMTSRFSARLSEQRFDMVAETNEAVGKNNIGSTGLICLVFARN